MNSQLSASMLVFGSLGLAVACNQGSDEKCTQAQTVIRQALGAKNFDAAMQWREYAYKQCSDKVALRALDAEIVTHRSQAEVAKQEALHAQQVHQQVLGVFQQWVAASRGAPERAIQNPVCEGDQDSAEAKNKERLCNGTRAISGADDASLSLRYWEKDPAESARYSVRLSLPTNCDPLGPNRIIKVIDAPATNGATVKRYYCEYMGGALNGLQALASEANNADLYVFTPKYLEHDASFAAQLK
jgi:hypothetical protein